MVITIRKTLLWVSFNKLKISIDSFFSANQCKASQVIVHHDYDLGIYIIL